MQATFVQDVLAEHKSREIREVKVQSDSYFTGKSIKDADIHNKTGIVLVGIGKNGNLIIDPPNELIIEEGDILLGIGKSEEFEKIEKNEFKYEFS
jgi:voltage-gated potassium channel